jgi:DNA-binding FrmR family transcriptional regulator
MPYSAQEKKKATTRLRRIRGQAEALERAIEAGTECGLICC